MIDPQTHVVFNLLTGVVALLLLPWLIGALRRATQQLHKSRRRLADGGGP